MTKFLCLESVINGFPKENEIYYWKRIFWFCSVVGFCQSSHQKNTIDLVENSVSGGGGETIECEFKRGICKFHNIKGKKFVLRTSKWCNVKGMAIQFQGSLAMFSEEQSCSKNTRPATSRQ